MTCCRSFFLFFFFSFFFVFAPLFPPPPASLCLMRVSSSSSSCFCPCNNNRYLVRVVLSVQQTAVCCLLRVALSVQQVSIRLQHVGCCSCSLSFPILLRHILHNTCRVVCFLFFIIFFHGLSCFVVLLCSRTRYASTLVR